MKIFYHVNCEEPSLQLAAYADANWDINQGLIDAFF